MKDPKHSKLPKAKPVNKLLVDDENLLVAGGAYKGFWNKNTTYVNGDVVCYVYDQLSEPNDPFDFTHVYHPTNWGQKFFIWNPGASINFDSGHPNRTTDYPSDGIQPNTPNDNRNKWAPLDTPSIFNLTGGYPVAGTHTWSQGDLVYSNGRVWINLGGLYGWGATTGSDPPTIGGVVGTVSGSGDWECISTTPAELSSSEPGVVSSSTSGTGGAAATSSRSDHDHDLGFVDATSDPLAVSTSAADGAEGSAARKDHVHPHEAAHINHDTTWSAKGDLIAATANDAASVLPVGTDTFVLTANSAETTGLKWEAATGGGGGVTMANRWFSVNKVDAVDVSTGFMYRLNGGAFSAATDISVSDYYFYDWQNHAVGGFYDPQGMIQAGTYADTDLFGGTLPSGTWFSMPEGVYTWSMFWQCNTIFPADSRPWCAFFSLSNPATRAAPANEYPFIEAYDSDVLAADLLPNATRAINSGTFICSQDATPMTAILYVPNGVADALNYVNIKMIQVA